MERKDFLSEFTSTAEENSSSLSACLNSLTYQSPFRYDERLNKLKELKDLTDRILSIVYNPHIRVETEEVVKRSEISGSLSPDSFKQTMLDSKLWKQKKNGMMSPEYVHSVETRDDIVTFENRFIALLIDEIEKDISSLTAQSYSQIESIEEHYQHIGTTFGPYSPFQYLRSNSYPYSSFFVKGETDQKALIGETRRINRRLKNLKDTEFYKENSKIPLLKRDLRPTNILLHDPLYSYCYRYYLNSYKGSSDDRRLNTLYFNYFTLSFLAAVRSYGMDIRRNSIAFNKHLLTFSSLTFSHNPFLFELSEDALDFILYCKIRLVINKKEIDSVTYAFVIRETYDEKSKLNFNRVKRKLVKSGVDQIILVTMNNKEKRIDNTITLNYYDGKDKDIISTLLTAMSVVFKASGDVYSSFCPVCGKDDIQFDGKRYICRNCHSTYDLFKANEEDLLYIRSYRKE